ARSRSLMQFGVQFFPSVGPAQKSADTYFAESLALAEEADALGFTHARTVEHYFEPYGGYTPNPIVFLSALSQRTPPIRPRAAPAPGPRGGPGGVPPPAQARRRDRHARRVVGRASRCRLRARLPAT